MAYELGDGRLARTRTTSTYEFVSHGIEFQEDGGEVWARSIRRLGDGPPREALFRVEAARTDGITLVGSDAWRDYFYPSRLECLRVLAEMPRDG